MLKSTGFLEKSVCIPAAERGAELPEGSLPATVSGRGGRSPEGVLAAVLSARFYGYL
jgi:hypothetical protein